MENIVRRAHAVAKELANEAHADSWISVYNCVFHAMLAGMFNNPPLGAAKQPETPNDDCAEIHHISHEEIT